MTHDGEDVTVALPFFSFFLFFVGVPSELQLIDGSMHSIRLDSLFAYGV